MNPRNQNLIDLLYVIVVAVIIIVVSAITHIILKCTDTQQYYEQRNRHRMYDPAADDEDKYISNN